VNMACGNAANRTQQGELMRLVAGGWPPAGSISARLAHEGGCHMTIACQGARCALPVTDWGNIEWECRPHASDDAAPGHIADPATTLLTGRATDHPRRRNGYGHDSATFNGIVGLELKARGLAVDIDVYEDKDHFDAPAEVVVTSPASGHDATGHVADYGGITWTRDYRPRAATIICHPDFCGRIADTAKVAGAVVQTITRAMSRRALVHQ
jgi:hypothetical protein